MISISHKDIWWSYFARFFNIAAGVIILPMILRMLSAQEIGMNYLMLAIGSMVTLFDFGFSPQFGRNITYILSGAKELKREGIELSFSDTEIDYNLLGKMIYLARYVYQRLSLIIFILMLSVGSLYIFKITKGFTNIDNSLLIWIIFCISTYFNIYFSYYTSLLSGKGLIKENSQAIIFSRLAYIIISVTLLLLGSGLLGVVIAAFVSPFINRFISYKYFFTKEIKKKIEGFRYSKYEVYEVFRVIWHNSKKLGIVLICAFVTTRLGLFFAGLFLHLEVIAAYGLMIQLVEILASVSGTLFEIYQPRFASLRVKGDITTLVKEFSFSMNIFYLLFLTGACVLLLFGSKFLEIIDSNTSLPQIEFVALYIFVILLERNHSYYATLITTRNDIPFVKPSIITSIFVLLGYFFSLKYTSYGVLGLIFIQGLGNIAYSDWKWPLVVLKEFNINFLSILNLGFKESIIRTKQNFKNGFNF